MLTKTQIQKNTKNIKMLRTKKGNMAAIPGWVYLLIGIAMAAISKIVNAKTNSNSLTLFFYLGLLAIVIGVVKFAFKAIIKSKSTPKNRNDPDFTEPLRNNRQNPFNPTAQIKRTDYAQGTHNIHRSQKQDYVQHPSVISCPGCGTRHYDYAHFCMKCGRKIK